MCNCNDLSEWINNAKNFIQSDNVDIMQKLNEVENTTFIFSTHDARVMKRAKRLITLEDGKVVGDEKQTEHK